MMTAAAARTWLVASDFWRRSIRLHRDVSPILRASPPGGRLDDIVNWRISLSRLFEHTAARRRLDLIQFRRIHGQRIDEAVGVRTAKIRE
jgi:hypothetical protein